MRFVGVAVCCAAVFFCSDVRAQPKKAPPTLSSSFTGEAKQAYEQARALFQKGDYEGALSAIQRTQQLSPDPRLFWNIAACEKKLGRHARAIGNVERYLSASASLLTDDEKREAQEFLAAARAYVSLVTVTGNADGTEIVIDGEVVGTIPLPKPLVVDQGEHRVRFSRTAYKSVERVEKVQGGTELRWVAQLEPEGRGPQPVEPARSPSRLGPILVGGAGVLIAGTGAVLVAITLDEASAIEQECGTSCPRSRWEKYRTLQTTGDVLLVVGAAAAIAGVTWWILQPSTSSPGPSARIAPAPYGFVLEGSL